MTKKLLAISILTTVAAFAHCDSLDGPVIVTARRALSTGNVNLVLPWVQPDQEPAIRQAFAQAVAVRTLDAKAEKLADTWFFETLVRIHRAGEGAPYEGLKPAGAGVTPALRSADAAIAAGDLQGLQKTLTDGVQQGLRERFSRVLELKGSAASDVNAGRKYVAAYVDFIHFAERLEQALSLPESHGAADHSH